MDVNFPKSLATTEPERRCLLLPRGVVLLGGGNSAERGDYRGGFLLLSSLSCFQKTTIPVETINPEGTGMGMDENTGGKDDQFLSVY